MRAKGHKISREGVAGVLRPASNGLIRVAAVCFERWNNEAAAEFGAARPSLISKGAHLPRAAIRYDNKRHWALLDAATRFAAK